MHETDAHTTRCVRQHLRRHVAVGQLITRREDERRAWKPDVPAEDDGVALTAIAISASVRVDDTQPRLAAVLGHRPRQLDAQIAARRIGIRQAAGLRLRAGDLVHLQRRSGHEIGDAVAGRVRNGRQTCADLVEERRRAAGRHADFVIGAKRRRLRCQQVVGRALVLRRLADAGIRARRGLRAGVQPDWRHGGEHGCQCDGSGVVHLRLEFTVRLKPDPTSQL